MPRIVWFRFNEHGRSAPKKRRAEPPKSLAPADKPPKGRFGIVDVSLAVALCVVAVLMWVLPAAPAEGINPALSPAPSGQSALNKPAATATPAPDRAVVIEQVVLKDTANAQISVPRIEGMTDETAQKAFNELVYRESGAQSLLELAAVREGDPANGMWEASLQYAAEQIGRVLHISTYAYTYTGGAHGAEARNEFYLDPQTGSIFRLADLFKDAQGAQDAILGYIDQAIAAYPDTFFTDAAASPLPTTFRIRQDGIEVYYPPYAIAPYAEGFPAFLIPWSAVNPYIDHDGVFIKALNDRR